MIGSTRQVTVWAYGAPADLRQGFDGLSALVSQGLARDPLSGDCYLFVNATRKRAKVHLLPADRSHFPRDVYHGRREGDVQRSLAFRLARSLTSRSH